MKAMEGTTMNVMNVQYSERLGLVSIPESEAEFEIGQTWVVRQPMGDHYYHVTQVSDETQQVTMEWERPWLPSNQFLLCDMAKVREMAELWAGDES